MLTWSYVRILTRRVLDAGTVECAAAERDASHEGWRQSERSPVKYDLEQLGPRGFQELAAALCLKALGPPVQVLGSGRDGGRDKKVATRFIVSSTIVWWLFGSERG
jgi:hypothetical protein